jgi:hypothetical protein
MKYAADYRHWIRFASLSAVSGTLYRSLPAFTIPLRALLVRRAGPFGGVVPPGTVIAFWSAQ